jgi:hypothetical protein
MAQCAKKWFIGALRTANNASWPLKATQARWMTFTARTVRAKLPTADYSPNTTGDPNVSGSRIQRRADAICWDFHYLWSQN